jgi:4-aminobutyrate aminotransferase
MIVAHLSPLLTQATGVMAARGEGVYLFDRDGRRYLDFTSGIGVTSTGHCHPKVVEAIQRQAATLIHGQYTTVLHPGLLRLGDHLARVMPDGLDSFFFTSAGTEAIEAALRLVRHATGRPNVVVFHGSFHGRTVGSLSLTTAKADYRAGVQPLMAGVVVAPFPYAYRYRWSRDAATEFCLRELDYALATLCAPDETAAFLIEPVLGEGGYVPATAEFMAGLRERCDRYGILLAIDEIQTGVGRTGRFWCHQHFGVQPDLLITAKGLASGMPLAALAAPRSLMARGRAGSQGGTYGGNAVACAAAIATLEVIREEGLVERAADLGRHLLGRLRGVAAEHPQIGDVRGLGLMVATEFSGADGAPDGETATRVQRHAAERGLLLLTCGPYHNVIRWIPPLVVTRDQIDQAVEMFTVSVAAGVARGAGGQRAGQPKQDRQRLAGSLDA